MVTATGDGLKVKYRKILIGFERYSFTEKQIYEARHEFEMALADFEACHKCDGSLCRTGLNYRCSNPYWHQACKHPCTDECYPSPQFRGYYGLWHKGCRSENRPIFAVHECPGSAERKEQILERMTSKHEGPWWDR